MLRLSNNSDEINEVDSSKIGQEDTIVTSEEALLTEQPETDMASLQNEITNLTNLLQRTQADFMNFKKRSEKEFNEMGALADQKLATLIIPLLDEIDLAKSHNDYDGTTKSLGEKISQLGERLGVSTFAMVGEVFDPNKHNAIEHTPGETEEVLLSTIYQQGYFVGDKLAREAIVGTSGGK